MSTLLLFEAVLGGVLFGGGVACWFMGRRYERVIRERDVRFWKSYEEEFRKMKQQTKERK